MTADGDYSRRLADQVPEVVSPEVDPVKHVFRWSDLDGKRLLFHLDENYLPEHGIGLVSMVDEETGISYVLEVSI